MDAIGRGDLCFLGEVGSLLATKIPVEDHRDICVDRVCGMPKVGVEPTRAYAHYALNVARLPIPPLRLAHDILL